MCHRMCVRRGWRMSTTAAWAAPGSIRKWLDQLPDHHSRPEPLENLQSPIDYEHYLSRQLQPVADAILPFVGDDFQALTDRQLMLF